jgi:hypothetical protein
MSMSEYYMDDYETYSSVFHQHSILIADMMRILDTSINCETNMVVGRPKDLFRMVMDMMYAVDKSYKKAKEIKEDDDYHFHYSLKDDAKEEMRTLLREEIERYFNTKSES